MPDAARSVAESRASGAGNQMRGGNTMARVPYPKLEDLPEADRPIYQRMARERGTGHIWLALANAPKILDAVMTMAGALRNDTVFEKRFRELGIVMVGLVTGSAYEFDH